MNLFQIKMDQHTEMMTLLVNSIKNKYTLSERQERSNFLLENNFPLSHNQDLELLEEKLKEENQHALEMELRKIGGDNVKHFFKGLIKYSFAKNFSWDGLKEKEAFRNLNLSTVIEAAIITNMFRGTENEAEKMLKEYLRRAKEELSKEERKIVKIIYK